MFELKPNLKNTGLDQKPAASHSKFDRRLKEVLGIAAGPQGEAQAAVLASASAHWLRHTAGSHMIDRAAVRQATVQLRRLSRASHPLS